uniref:Large ribosomal subunit protein mL40 n=1 Tax=Calidris pygmaea TaxID=425635 RepID=A0A8C3K9R8_9CHAR
GGGYQRPRPRRSPPPRTCPPGTCRPAARPPGPRSPLWLTQVAQPKKKKKVDVKKEQAQKERMKKKIRKLEKAAPEMIPIEDFLTPLKFSDSTSLPPLSLEETERRVLLLKKWCLFKQNQDKVEKAAIQALVEAQQEALRELRLESEELYQAAIRRDPGLFPFQREGPDYTPPLPGYDPPEGKCVDITKVYTQ